LHLGARSAGIDLDYERFFVYLNEHYAVNKAFIFLGFVAENQNKYEYLKKSGFTLIFKETSKNKNGELKGNADVDLTVFVFENMDKFEKAILVTSDGDFYPLVKSLRNREKMEVVLSPTKKKCSYLLKKYACGKLRFLDPIKDYIVKTKKRPRGQNLSGRFS